MTARPRRLHRNVWATSATSFLTDVSSEMLLNVLPLFLANVLGVRVWAVGAVEGLADTTASLLKLYSGWLSDRLGARKWLAVTGYAVSALSKPFYWFATSWTHVAAIRWGDRVGKGVRTAPRDALLADSTPARRRGLAFGLHRAADTGGAVVGLLVTLQVVASVQGGGALLAEDTFRTLVLYSLAPAFLAVVVLAVWATDVDGPDGAGDPAGTHRGTDAGEADGADDPAETHRGTDAGEAGRAIDAGEPDPAGDAGGTHPHGRPKPEIRIRGVGSGFAAFVACSVVFELGNSADAFLVLRAQERGLSVLDVLWILLGFNVVYAAVATPAGALADRISRRAVVAGAWTLYALCYLGFAVARDGGDVVALYLLYGVYHGLVAGAAKALVADLVPRHLRGVAYGGYAAAVGIVGLPASLLGGLLWEGFGPWSGFGAAAPFAFGAATAAAAVGMLLALVPGHAAPGPADAHA